MIHDPHLLGVSTLSSKGAAGTTAGMTSYVLAAMRLFRISIVLIGLMQLGIVSTSFTLDLHGPSSKAFKQAPAPLLQAARSGQVAILTGNGVTSSGSVKLGNSDLLSLLPGAGPELNRQSTPAWRISINVHESHELGGPHWKPPVRAPPQRVVL